MTDHTMLAGQEARILLTSRCNYRCVFCHREGIGDVSASQWVPNMAATLRVVDRCLAAGCRDITLTGGEPLLEPEIVLSVIGQVAKRAEDAQVTVVSNAALLEEVWLARLPGNGNLRFNISLHTNDPPQYSRITGQKHIHVEHIRSRLALLRKHGIPFKINAVALRNLTDAENVESLCEFASQEGAAALKIIELLIMEKSESLFPEYVSLETIAKRLPKDFSLVRQADRRREYCSPRMGLTLELQKCRCRFGCRHCLTNKTANFNSEGRYWPCFEFSEKSFHASESLDKPLQEGYRILTKMAEDYGDQSPSLIKDVQLTRRRREVFFIVSNEADISDLLDGARKDRVIDFHETYFKPSQQTSQPTGHQAKLRVHAGDPDNAVMILSTVRMERDINGLPITATVFLEDCPLPIHTKAKTIQGILEHLHWVGGTTVRLEGAEYISPAGAVFSICRLHPTQKSILRIAVETDAGRRLAQRFAAEPLLRLIHQAFPEFVLENGWKEAPESQLTRQEVCSKTSQANCSSPESY